MGDNGAKQKFLNEYAKITEKTEARKKVGLVNYLDYGLEACGFIGHKLGYGKVLTEKGSSIIKTAVPPINFV